jgi:hypothetical protein
MVISQLLEGIPASVVGYCSLDLRYIKKNAPPDAIILLLVHKVRVRLTSYCFYEKIETCNISITSIATL